MSSKNGRATKSPPKKNPSAPQKPEATSPAEKEPSISDGQVPTPDPLKFDEVAGDVGAGSVFESDDPVAGAVGALADASGEIDDLDEQDISGILELVFGLIADTKRRPHWQMPETTPENQRIAKWVHKFSKKHGLEWLKEWMPEAISAGLLLLAVSRRVQADRELGPVGTKEEADYLEVKRQEEEARKAEEARIEEEMAEAGRDAVRAMKGGGKDS